ncbi:hypothetical protein QBC32DRAFT_209878 [Pseudoneurospora amorphoporcata]|uniref:Uncharacterized protein n=1 Tax=Pseudoneurospora amorphoporcata TaxID=241081 RepID=A0AAN6P0W5_9PEZI|nr:hypothetical protein QBC32DRAFT_209878 [Pseudoneurospora amorphoporcata]
MLSHIDYLYTYDLVTIFSLAFTGVFWVLSLLSLWVRLSQLVMTGWDHPNSRKAGGYVSRYVQAVLFVASQGVSQWNVFSQWVSRSCQARRLRNRRTGRAYIEVDGPRRYVASPTPAPPIVPGNQTADQSETTVEHQTVPKYLRSQREDRLGSHSFDCPRLAHRSTREREEARPASSVIGQAVPSQVAETTTAASAPASPPTPVSRGSARYRRLLERRQNKPRGVLRNSRISDPVDEQILGSAFEPAVSSPRAVVAPTPISEPVVTTEPTPTPVAPALELIHAEMMLTLPDIVITPPTPVFVPETPAVASQVVDDNGIPSSNADELVPESILTETHILDIVTVPSVLAPTVAPQPQLVAQNLAVSELEIEPLSRCLERAFGFSPSVFEHDRAFEGLILSFGAWHLSVQEQQTVVENGVLSPLLVPVSTAHMSSADDLIPSVDESMEPVSAAISLDDDDVDMEEDLSVLPIAGPEFNGVASLSSDRDLSMTDEVATKVQSGLSDDQHMHDGNDSHQVWMPEEPSAVSSDMELCPQQFPETGAFSEQVVPATFSFGTQQQPDWPFSSVVDSQFTFGNPMPSFVPQLQGPEHDMADAPPQPGMVSTHFERPMVNLTSPVDSFEADTSMEDIYGYEPLPVFSGHQQQQQPSVFFRQPTPATSDYVPVPDTIEVAMEYLDPEMLTHVVAPMAFQPSPVPVTIEFDMGLDTSTPALQAVDTIVSPVSPEQSRVVSDIAPAESDDSVLDSRLFEPIGISPGVEQQPEQAVSQPDPAVDELQDVREHNPEEYPDVPEAPEVNTEPEMAAPSFIPDVDDGVDNGPLVLSRPATPTPDKSWHHELFGTSPLGPAQTPPNRSLTPPPPFNFTNATFQPVLPAGAPAFTTQSFQPTLPVGAPGFTAPTFQPNLRRRAPVVEPAPSLHMPVESDDESFRRQMAEMARRAEEGRMLTRAESASVALQVAAAQAADRTYGPRREDENFGGSIESSNLGQRTMLVPRSQASRAAPASTATPSVLSADPVNVAPVADMGPVGDITPSVNTESPGEEDLDEDELDKQDLEQELQDEFNAIPSDSEDEPAGEAPVIENVDDPAVMAASEVMQRRKIKAPRGRRRNLPSQNNTDNEDRNHKTTHKSIMA